MALPFVSSGGSGMVTSLAGVGLLLSISRGRVPSEQSGRRSHPGRRSQSGGREVSRQYASLDRRWGNRGTRISRSRRRASASRHR
jgi:hypothetical protein